MATILLTDEEYNHIKTQLEEVTGKIAGASPRAATHYATLARLHADFLAKEDSKRALAQAKSSTRATIEKQKQARRAALLQRQQQAAQQASAATGPGAGRAAKSA